MTALLEGRKKWSLIPSSECLILLHKQLMEHETSCTADGKFNWMSPCSHKPWTAFFFNVIVSQVFALSTSFCSSFVYNIQKHEQLCSVVEYHLK